jgi:hypothetical protein
MEAQGVSREALKGPQGPAPHMAEEFEQEQKKGAKDAQPGESSELFQISEITGNANYISRDLVQG